jgi:hypothetical protein
MKIMEQTIHASATILYPDPEAHESPLSVLGEAESL